MQIKDFMYDPLSIPSHVSQAGYATITRRTPLLRSWVTPGSFLPMVDYDDYAALRITKNRQ